MTAPFRLGPWRVSFQWATSLALLLLPFLRVGGESALRVDLPRRTLLAFGSALRLEEASLFLLLALAVVLGFLLSTLVLGRVWCGWACPQTTLSDLAEAFAARLGARREAGAFELRGAQAPLFHAFCAALGLLVGANLVWYFVSPYDFFPLLRSGALPAPAAATVAAMGGAVYLDLAFVRRRFCRTVCPYGRLQAALVDAGTLTLGMLPDAAPRCIACRACLRACPTGIDVREGDQAACIACGRCRDACAEVMERRGEPGLIGYTFGRAGRGARALLTPRTAAAALATAAALGGFGVALSARAPLALSVRQAAAPPRVLPDGAAAVFFTAYASNRTRAALELALTAHEPQGRALELRGPVAPVALGGGARRQLDFALVAPPSPEPRPVVFRLAAPGGKGPAAEARATVGPTGPPGDREGRP
jgi:polyferredoxin